MLVMKLSYVRPYKPFSGGEIKLRTFSDFIQDTLGPV